MVEVAAALIWSGNKFMICQRPAHKGNGLLWEFVGGKAEKGETLQEALIRECREELDVLVSVGDEFTDVVHQYPDIKVHLTVFNAEIVSGTPKLLEHNDLKWITPDEIPNYDFCKADADILDKIILMSKEE
ncbi:MAG: (deoxy)nucleoside triphosphate pyrophosphohydrolase [Clostridia bacterium]|nr:(deoxy)nucleoside triphosphate pyrophosphohydrolase [Clostridia bacterium]